MMLHTHRSPVSHLAFAALLVMGLVSGPDAIAGTPGGIVRCMQAREAVHASIAGDRMGVLSSHDRFFAPTHDAVFFSRAGDRCVWHAGAPLRG